MILFKKNIVGPLALLILLLTFFYSYASRSLFDSDFWWHISTGRHILQHNTIPDTDPFSFTSGLEENKNLYPLRENFILKQYWLAQIIFYRIYDYAGAAGIIVLRALLLTLTIVFVLWRLQRWRNNLCVQYMKNNQIDSAIEVFEKAIMMKEKAYLYSNFASAYAKKGYEEKSRLMYQKALELGNNNE